MHHVYFDEFEHIHIAENMFLHGKTSLIIKGGYGLYEIGTPEAWPAGYHALLASIFSIFGSSEAVAFNTSAVIGSISIILIFLVAYLLFNDRAIALIAAFLFNLIPVHLKYSGASELGLTSLLFVLLTVLSLFLYVKDKNSKSLFLLIVTLVLAVYMRPENFLLLFLALFFAIRPLALFLSSVFLLLAPFFMHLYISLLVQPHPGWDTDLMGRLLNLKNQLPDNILFWFSPFNPLTFTLMSLMGLFYLIRKNRRLSLLLISWFAVFLLLYSQHTSGSFLRNPDGDRFTLYLYVPLILFAAFGLYEFIRPFRFKKSILCVTLFFMALDIFSPLRKGLERTFSREVYQEYRFIKNSRDLLADDIYCITYTPWVLISTIHKKAVMPDIFKEMEPLPQKAVLFKDYWWGQWGRASGEFEQWLKERYDFSYIAEKRVSRAGTFSFMELDKKR